MKTTFEEKKDSFRVTGLPQRDGLFVVDVSKELLKLRLNSEQLAGYSVAARKHGDFYVGSAPLYHALFKAVYQNQNNPVAANMRDFLKEVFGPNNPLGIQTLTRIQYKQDTQANFEDTITHNYAQPDEYEVRLHIPQCHFERFRQLTPEQREESKPAYHTLLEDDDLESIPHVYRMLSGKDILFVTARSIGGDLEHDVERAFCMSAGKVGGFILSADMFLDMGYPALGIKKELLEKNE